MGSLIDKILELFDSVLDKFRSRKREKQAAKFKKRMDKIEAQRKRKLSKKIDFNNARIEELNRYKEN